LVIALEDNEKSQSETMNQPNVAKMSIMEVTLHNLDTGVNNIKNDIGDLRKDIGDLRKDMSSFKDDVRKSMYAVGIVQIITILGGLVAIMKFMK
jgi:hypothetical protein